MCLLKQTLCEPCGRVAYEAFKTCYQATDLGRAKEKEPEMGMSLLGLCKGPPVNIDVRYLTGICGRCREEQAEEKTSKESTSRKK